MIIKEVKITGVETMIKFSGDPKVQWFVRDLYNTNRSTPYISSIVNGMATLQCDPRSVGDPMKLEFYTEGEQQLAKEVDDVVNAPEKKSWLSFLPSFAKVKTESWETIKRIPLLVGVVILGGIAWSLFDNFVLDTGNASYWYKELSMAGVKDTVDGFIENKDENYMIATNNHPVYKSAKIKEIEDKFNDPATEEKDLSFPAMFQYVGNGIFLMKDVITKGDEVLYFDQDDAEDQCEMIDTYLPTDAILKEEVKTIRVKDRSSVPEWTIESDGIMSDDYVVFMKDADMFDGAYIKNGRVLVDADDAKLAARCMFRAKDFEE